MTDALVFSQRDYAKFYCGFMFIGYCTSDDLVDHFFEFVRDLGSTLTYCWRWKSMAPMSTNHSNRHSSKSLKKRCHILLECWYMF